MFKSWSMSVVFLSLSLSAMEKSVLQPWIQQTEQISIETTSGAISVPIQNATTVLDVKKFLHELNKTPVELQLLKATWCDYSGLWGVYDNEGDELGDLDNIKQVMNAHNSNSFRMLEKLPRVNAIEVEK